MNGIDTKGNLSKSSILRLEKAIEIYSGSEMFIPCTLYTVNKKPIIKNGFPLSESELAAKKLESKGINRNKIYPESFSYDTIGNIYLSKLIQVEPLGINKLIIVTSAYHMDRTKFVFEWIYNLKPNNKDFKFYFHKAIDPPMDIELKNEVIAAENKKLNSLKLLAEKINTKADFHTWFFHDHSAYTFYKKTSIINSNLSKIY